MINAWPAGIVEGSVSTAMTLRLKTATLRTPGVPAQDNGTGMPHEDIPGLLGRVLSGTKYGVKQTRGKFGLGAKMALIWSKLSTGLPIEVLSARRKQAYISYYKLDIDIHKCAASVVRRARRLHIACSLSVARLQPMATRHCMHSQEGHKVGMSQVAEWQPCLRVLGP